MRKLTKLKPNVLFYLFQNYTRDSTSCACEGRDLLFLPVLLFDLLLHGLQGSSKGGAGLLELLLCHLHWPCHIHRHPADGRARGLDWRGRGARREGPWSLRRPRGLGGLGGRGSAGPGGAGGQRRGRTGDLFARGGSGWRGHVNVLQNFGRFGCRGRRAGFR